MKIQKNILTIDCKGSIMDRKTKENTMKTRKVLALAGVTLLAAGVLAACSGSGSSAKGEKTFSYVYETDPDNLNYLTTGKAATTDITSNVRWIA